MAKVLTFGLLLLMLFACSVSAQTTEFAYQGSLRDNGAPANNNYDLEFALYDNSIGGSQLGPTIQRNMIAVANGAFSVKLDFGSVFPGANRYLEIRVKVAGAGPYSTLAPRQLVNSSPYSITAGDATSLNIARLNVPNTAMTATGMPVVNSGFITSATVTNGGAGYGAPPTVTVNDATGSGAVLTANISGGAVTSLTVQNPGSGYSAGATLTIASPPSNASQTFVSRNFFTGVNTMNNVNNTFTGSFTGNGAALTNVNAAQLGGVAAGGYVLTGDVRLFDARDPLPGSGNYIQNSTSQQSSSNFNIAGNGTVGGMLTAASLSGNGSGLTNVPGTLRWQGPELVGDGPRFQQWDKLLFREQRDLRIGA